MSSDTEPAARRITEQFGETSHVPYLDIEESDVGVLLGFPVAALFGVGLTGVDALALPAAIVGFVVGAVVVYASPRHLGAWTWTKDVLRYLARPDVTVSSSCETRTDRAETESPTSDRSGPTVIGTDDRTEDLTNVERAWPGAGAIQRTDGAMEAFLELDPGNMDFATSEDWARLQEVGAAFANTELEWKLTFHATTRSFPVEEMTGRIEDRLEDDDLADKPVFRRLLEEYRQTRPREMRQRGIQQMRYFVGVEVTPLEVYGAGHEERTPAEKLTDVPVVGFLFNPFMTRREDLTDAERRARMFDRLDDRVSDVQSEFVQRAPGWSARRLSTVELFLLNTEFWNGAEHDYGDLARAVRETGVLGSSRRQEATDD